MIYRLFKLYQQIFLLLNCVLIKLFAVSCNCRFHVLYLPLPPMFKFSKLCSTRAPHELKEGKVYSWISCPTVSQVSYNFIKDFFINEEILVISYMFIIITSYISYVGVANYYPIISKNSANYTLRRRKILSLVRVPVR
jgi:hypothetical protein